MNWRRVLPATAVIVLAVVAALGAVLVIQVRRPDQARLARLVTAAPPAGFKTRAASHSVVPASNGPYPALQAAAKHAPGSTGSYSVEWAGTASSGDSVSALVSLLPSASQASTARSQGVKSFLAANSYVSASAPYSFHARFAVTGVPGADGAAYTPGNKTNKESQAVVIERVGRVVALVLVQQSGGIATAERSAVAAAQAEYRRLVAVTPGFTLEASRWPVTATAVYSVAALLVVAAPVAVPVLVGRARRRRRAARLASARRQVLSRGGKIARRQSARHH